MSDTPAVYHAPAEAPAPAPLSAERLAEIRELQAEWKAYAAKKAYTSNPPQLATTYAGELLAAYDAQAAALAVANHDAAHSDDCAQRAYGREMEAHTARKQAESALHRARPIMLANGIVECAGDPYTQADVLDYLHMRSGNPFLEAAHEFLLLLTSRAAEAKAQVAMLRVELAEQERAKLLLIQETCRWSDAEKRDKVRHQEEMTALTTKYERKLNAYRAAHDRKTATSSHV